MFVDEEWMHINANTPKEVMAQCAHVDNSKLRLSVYADEKKMFLDAEGCAEIHRGEIIDDDAFASGGRMEDASRVREQTATAG